MDFGDQRFAVDHLVEYVETATGLGFDAVSANDHMVFGVPWPYGPTALAAVVSCSGDARLFTTVANPVVRGAASRDVRAVSSGRGSSVHRLSRPRRAL
jgi:hypothetical protein